MESGLCRIVETLVPLFPMAIAAAVIIVAIIKGSILLSLVFGAAYVAWSFSSAWRVR